MKTENGQITIIVPAYNAQDTIEACITSITNQTYTNLQIIIIDDGSTDDTSHIVNHLAKMDNRIAVYHEENRGVSCARNLGIEHTTGEYVFFVDADDQIRADTLDIMVKAAKLDYFDMVACSNSNSNSRRMDQLLVTNQGTLEAKTPEEIGKQVYYYYLGSACGKLFRRENLSKNHVRFPENLQWAEDMIFVHNYLVHCKKITKVPIEGYQINNINENSLSKIYVENMVECANLRQQAIEAAFEIFPEYKRVYYEHQMPLRTDYCKALAQNLFLRKSPYSFSESVQIIQKDIIDTGEVDAFFVSCNSVENLLTIDRIQRVIFRTKSANTIAIFYYMKEYIKKKKRGC